MGVLLVLWRPVEEEEPDGGDAVESRLHPKDVPPAPVARVREGATTKMGHTKGGKDNVNSVFSSGLSGSSLDDYQRTINTYSPEQDPATAKIPFATVRYFTIKSKCQQTLNAGMVV